MKKKEGFDLNSIDTVKGSNEGFDVQIYHPGTNEDLGITITILGKDSDEFQKVSRAQSKKRIQKMSKGGFRNTNVPLEEIESDSIDLLASCTRGWKQDDKLTITVDGKEIACSKENAGMLYERFPWIKEQVDTAMGDRANFIRS